MLETSTAVPTAGARSPVQYEVAPSIVTIAQCGATLGYDQNKAVYIALTSELRWAMSRSGICIRDSRSCVLRPLNHFVRWISADARTSAISTPN